MEEYRKLSAKKGEIESSIKALMETLEQHGVGMHESLVDSSDFPRSDIDIYTVRQARHNIICLQNDHVAVMKQLEEKIYEIHALARLKGTAHDSSSSGNTNSENVATANSAAGIDSSAAFVTVDSVAHGSPAHTAGLLRGDAIVEFGSITKANYKALSDIGQAVLHSKDRPLRVAVLRDGLVEHLTLTPQEWSGKGLLGCHIINVNSSAK